MPLNKETKPIMYDFFVEITIKIKTIVREPLMIKKSMDISL